MTAAQWLPAWSRQTGDERALALFAEAFPGATPDGAWSAPGRVNIIGEHTDYNGGLCLPIALPHRTYIALRRRDDDVVRLASAQAEGVWTMRLADVAPGQVKGWGAYVVGVAWALREAGHEVGGFDAVVDSCVPFGASLSSSAALECAVAVALDEVYGLGLGGDVAGRRVLVDACRLAENDIAGAPTGGLDQSASMLCGPGQAIALDFAPDVAPEDFVRPVPFDLAAAGLSLLVIDTRAPHALVDGQYAARRTACEHAADLLGVPTLREVPLSGLEPALAALGSRPDSDVLVRRVRHVVTEIARTAKFADVVREGLGADGVPDEAAIARAGALMNASHDSLRDDYEVTVRETDLAVDASRTAGAIGARMTGGGFGGSTIALVRASELHAVADAVAQAFEQVGLTPPAFLEALPSGAAA